MSIWKSLTRKKTLPLDVYQTKLNRVLSLFDLTLLGVGATVGLGIYLLAGMVAYSTAGPAVVISFAIAAAVSIMSAFCYAEFAARIPRAGSAYIYTYVTIGELVAFTIGWDMLIEYAIGTSSLASGMSGYIDEMLGNPIYNYFREIMPIDHVFFAPYPQFFALGIIILLTIILIVGVQQSVIVNNVCTIVNLLTVLITVIAGLFKLDFHNWNILEEEIPENLKETAGKGGFMPFGIAGIARGAATCFYGFVGFDIIATTGEEAKNPQKNIPLAFVISISIIFIAYTSISIVLTLMVPYYEINPNAPFPHIFNAFGWHAIKWIVTIGALFALTNALVGAQFPIPRIVYSMGVDGVLFKCFSSVNQKSRTPIPATIFSGFVAGFIAFIFNLEQLIDMMSIGTLLAYTIVATCVLVLRYRDQETFKHPVDADYHQYLRQLLNLDKLSSPTNVSSRITVIGITIYSIISAIFCTLIRDIFDYEDFEVVPLYIKIASSICIFLLILCVGVIFAQPESNIELFFKAPAVPFLPCLSILCNIYLMIQLDPATWVRLLIWMAIGFIIYIGYGITNSAERQITEL